MVEFNNNLNSANMEICQIIQCVCKEVCMCLRMENGEGGWLRERVREQERVVEEERGMWQVYPQ